MERLIREHVAAIPDADWQAIGPFVQQVVATLGFTSVRKTKNYFTAVAAHVHWCWRVLDIPLDVEVIFHLDVISNFIASGCDHFAQSTRASYRSRLRQVANTVLDGANTPMALEPIAQFENASAPYSVNELKYLRAWAGTQRTDYRIVNATVLLALGLGAGLATSEIIAIRAGDVHVDDAGVLLDISGSRARQVPMLAEWEPPIADLARAAMRPTMNLFAPRRHVEAHPNLVSNFLYGCQRPPVQLTAQRLRSTWIVGHMCARVPADVLLRASGIRHPEGLARYAPFVPEANPDELRRWLRGTRVAASDGREVL